MTTHFSKLKKNFTDSIKKSLTAHLYIYIYIYELLVHANLKRQIVRDICKVRRLQYEIFIEIAPFI